LTLREAARRGLPTDAVADLALWVVLGGAVGARLLHVVDRWDSYATDPLRILAIQNVHVTRRNRTRRPARRSWEAT